MLYFTQDSDPNLKTKGGWLRPKAQDSHLDLRTKGFVAVPEIATKPET